MTTTMIYHNRFDNLHDDVYVRESVIGVKALLAKYCSVSKLLHIYIYLYISYRDYTFIYDLDYTMT